MKIHNTLAATAILSALARSMETHILTTKWPLRNVALRVHRTRFMVSNIPQSVTVGISSLILRPKNPKQTIHSLVREMRRRNGAGNHMNLYKSAHVT